MANRLIAIERSADKSRSAYVYYKADSQEYIVTFAKNEVKMTAATYYTDDKQDAIGTAHCWCIENVHCIG